MTNRTSARERLGAHGVAGEARKTMKPGNAGEGRDHDAGEQSEPHAARMGAGLRGRNRQQGVSSADALPRRCGCAGGSRFKQKAEATKGRTFPLSHLYGHFGLVRL